MSKAASPTDPARMAILANRFESIARQMAHTLHRTGRSGLINTARDLSCCILTADHELLSEAESLPSHVLVGPDIMSRWLKEWHPHVQRGDAFLHNSPYHGNSHAADHTIIVPVVDDDDVHRFTVFAKAHQADIGNSRPTSYFSDARDVYEEGALIFPGVQVQRDYESKTSSACAACAYAFLINGGVTIRLSLARGESASVCCSSSRRRSVGMC